MAIFNTHSHLTPKLNITFFMGNVILNIFSFNSFFYESNIFRENGEKKFWWTWPFLVDGVVLYQNEYNLFFFFAN